MFDGKFRTQRLIGKGGFGQVYEISGDKGRRFACKVEYRSQLVKSLENEARIMKHLAQRQDRDERIVP